VPRQESPSAVRGAFYTTHLAFKCHDYNPCSRCLQCTNYSPHQAKCQICESVKHPKRVCKCSVVQREGIIDLEKKLGRPMWSPNYKDSEVSHSEEVMTTSFNQANKEILQRIRPLDLDDD